MRTLSTLAVIVGFLLPASLVSTASAQPRCEAPRVMVVIDRSSSMAASRTGYLPSGLSKWGAARAAVEELTGAFADRADFGIALFPSVDGENNCNPGGVVLDVGAHSASDIMESFPVEDPPYGGNWTPTAQTLDGLVDTAALTDTSRDRHVVLVTDGEQCCISGSTCISEQRFWPIEAIDHLRSMGVFVHVVGFGSGVDALTLNRSAVAGGTAMAGCDMDGEAPSDTSCYHHADDLADLAAAFDRIGRFITEEVCDGYDNDCDNSVDEDYDFDTDTYTTCGSDITVPGTPLDEDLVDCDDTDLAVNPAATEVCNGIDDDCDGVTDPGCACTEGETQSCGTDLGVCMEGTQLCGADGTWGECDGSVEPSSEICDGYDDDCDGTTDESATCDPMQACIDGACRSLEPLDENGGCCTVAAGSKTPNGRYALAFAFFVLALAGFRIRRRR
jgi:MYXO-CTERM domain-containing protein